jgi:hypothetical protein
MGDQVGGVMLAKGASLEVDGAVLAIEQPGILIDRRVL